MSSENFDLSTNVFAQDPELKIKPKPNDLIPTKRELAICATISLILGIPLLVLTVYVFHHHDGTPTISE